MPRHTFTDLDFAPLRSFLAQPAAQKLLASAVPVKLFGPGPGHAEDTGISPPVDIRTREAPQGVPLEHVLTALQTQVPSVHGLVLRNGTLQVSATQPLSSDDREKVARLLTNRGTLAALNVPAASVAAPPSGDLVQKLLNADTADADWMKAFRQYAVTNLVR